MITLLLFVVLLVLALLVSRIWVRALAVMATVAIYVASTGFLNGAFEQWAKGGEQQVAAVFADKQLIVLLGLGVDERNGEAVVPTYALPRLLKAVEVYRSCQIASQCTVLISGGATGKSALTEAKVYQDRILQAAPDLKGHVELEDRSRNTWENASFSSVWARAHGYDSARLVTSLLHMRRSQAYFHHFGLATYPEYSEQIIGPSSWLPSAWNLAMVDIIVHEQIGFWRYELYEAMGWNSVAATPE